MDSSWNRFWDSKVEVEVDVAVVVTVAAAAAMSCKFDLKQKVKKNLKKIFTLSQMTNNNWGVKVRIADNGSWKKSRKNLKN